MGQGEEYLFFQGSVEMNLGLEGYQEMAQGGGEEWFAVDLGIHLYEIILVTHISTILLPSGPSKG